MFYGIMGLETPANETGLVLGIDLGTTSVKVSLYDGQETLQSASCDTHAKYVCSSQPHGAAEQLTSKIMETCETCLSKLDAGKLSRVKRVGITGQMHGCVCWSSYSANVRVIDQLELAGASKIEGFNNDLITTSPLVTWEDSRCTEDFIASLPTPNTHLRLATGHGCVTLFWLQRNNPEYLQKFTQAGTIMDLLVSRLCCLDKPIMGIQNAASWGYFNVSENTWNREILTAAGFPVHLLPEVVDPGDIVGQLRSPWQSIPAGCKVGVAMGDLPCSVLPLLRSPSDAVVNIGTSAQLVTSTPAGFDPLKSTPSITIEYFPFFKGQYLAVAAALTGGNVIAHCVSSLCQLASDFGLSISKEDAYKKFIDKGLEVKDTSILICPTLYGERHVPSQRASVENLAAGNMSVGDISRALCRGIITNLHSMMSRDDLIDRGVGRIVGCGSALLRNPVLMQELESVFKMPVVHGQGGDAAEGAAMAMLM